MRQSHMLASAAALITLASLHAACDDQRRHGAILGADIAPAATSLPADAQPIEIARAVLEALRDVQHARAAGLGTNEKKANYKSALGRVWALTAQDRVYENIRQYGQRERGGYVPQNISREAAITLVTESWASIIAHYVDGLDFSTFTMMPDPPRNDSSVVISLEAENPNERSALAAIEASPAFIAAKASPPNSPGTAEPTYKDLLRRETLRQGFNLPTRVLIEIKLESIAGSWRATSLKIELSNRPPQRAASPTTLPNS